MATRSKAEAAAAQPTIIRTTIPRRPRRHLPRTFGERVALGVRELRVPASFEEFLALAHDCDYRIHYREGHIISFIEIDEHQNGAMGEASIRHEALVARLIRLLSELLEDKSSEYHVLGSNTRIFMGNNRRGFNADVTVVKGAVQEQVYKFNKRSVKGLANPWLIVEVLSDSTRDFDLSEKLPDYKGIPSLQQVILIEQDGISASTYIRLSHNEWRNLELTEFDDAIPIGEGQLPLRRIYEKLPA